MNRKTSREIAFGTKSVARRAINFAKQNPAFKVEFHQWVRSQPGSTRRGVNRQNFVLPSYVLES